MVVQQIRGRELAQTSSFSPSAGNGSVILTVHDVWGGTALASEPLRVVPVKLDTALVGSVLAQIDDLSAEALASNSSQGNAAATQLVGALAATLNTQGEEAKAEKCKDMEVDDDPKAKEEGKDKRPLPAHVLAVRCEKVLKRAEAQLARKQKATAAADKALATQGASTVGDSGRS